MNRVFKLVTIEQWKVEVFLSMFISILVSLLSIASLLNAILFPFCIIYRMLQLQCQHKNSPSILSLWLKFYSLHMCLVVCLWR